VTGLRDEVKRSPLSTGRSALLGMGALISTWPWCLNEIQFSEQTRTPEGPSSPTRNIVRELISSLSTRYTQEVTSRYSEQNIGRSSNWFGPPSDYMVQSQIQFIVCQFLLSLLRCQPCSRNTCKNRQQNIRNALTNIQASKPDGSLSASLYSSSIIANTGLSKPTSTPTTLNRMHSFL
jgi:hypothetical protein